MGARIERARARETRGGRGRTPSPLACLLLARSFFLAPIYFLALATQAILMTCHYPDLGGASDWLKICFNQSEAISRSGSDTSSEWNSCARFSDVIGKPVVVFSLACVAGVLR